MMHIYVLQLINQGLELYRSGKVICRKIQGFATSLMPGWMPCLVRAHASADSSYPRQAAAEREELVNGSYVSRLNLALLIYE